MSLLALLFRVNPATLAALPAENVIETMRPLPYERIAGTPDFVLGAAVVRGVPTPIVDVGALLGMSAERDRARRWLALRVGSRIVALAVHDVLGVRRLSRSSMSAAPPPLLSTAARGAVTALSMLDGELLVVLETARLFPVDMWSAIERGAA
jgi:purine-binding chemotaxis protein CheW